MKGHNFASILYRYIFYHSTLEFWLRSQCQQITPSTYKYVLLLFSLNSNNGAVRIMTPLFMGAESCEKSESLQTFFATFLMYTLYGSKKLRKKFGNFYFRQ